MVIFYKIGRGMDKKKTYISLFSSAGIGCYGFKKEGFDCIATCELIPSRLDIQRANKKCKYDSGYIVGDLTQDEIKGKLFKEIDFWRKSEEIKGVDVVVATPPCQGMSTANYKKGDEQKRNSLVIEAISIIQKVKPKVFVFENVKAFLKTQCTDISGDEISIEESITRNLGEEYHIYSRVINFKDYGVPSSRPRTIVIGTLKEYIHISPLNIFPLKEKQRTVRDVIGDLPSLNYGEISDDILHFFRKYPPYMEDWISHISEGESAFNNEDKYKPYKVVNGKKVLLKGAHLGNKFRRLFWDKPGACIATRNDQLASQDTIHPKDNRVLSIRELMRLMTIPDDFKWTKVNLNSFKTIEDKELFFRENELNIRRCIGEAVPTHIMQTIAKNTKELLAFQEYVEGYYSNRKKGFSNAGNNSFYVQAFNYEMQLKEAKKTGSFYTPQTVVFEALSTLDLRERKTVNILEPSVGMGAFLPQLFRICDTCDNVYVDVCDCDITALNQLKDIIKYISYDKSIFKLKYINDDFLLTDKIKSHYDLIVSNPPFAKVKKEDLKEYRKLYNIGKTTNIFSFFLERYRVLSDEIVVILPKSFIMASEYNEIRKKYEQYGIKHIVDYGVRYFKKVFVEILSFHFKKGYSGEIVIDNKLNNEIFVQKQGYIFHDKYWLLYRNTWFDNYIKRLKLDVFDVFRDRQITNPKLSDSGDTWVLRSKNILDNGVICSKEGYNKYIKKKDVKKYSVGKFLNTKSIIFPNFTYLTRAAILPDNCIPNGSIAILLPKQKLENVDLMLYQSEDFRKYYEIVKNKAKFTLNLDSNAIYYIGVKND